MKYFITFFAILFVLGLMLYFFVFQGYDTMTQAESIQQRLQNRRNTSDSDDVVSKTGLVDTTSGTIAISSGLAGVSGQIVKIESDGGTTSPIATESGSLQVSEIPTTLDQLDDVQQTSNQIASDPVDNQIDASQTPSSTPTTNSNSSSTHSTTTVDPEFEQVQALVNDLL